MWLSNGITLRNISQVSGASGEISAELMPVGHRTNSNFMLVEEVGNRPARVDGSSLMNVDCTVFVMALEAHVDDAVRDANELRSA